MTNSRCEHKHRDSLGKKGALLGSPPMSAESEGTAPSRFERARLARAACVGAIAAAAVAVAVCVFGIGARDDDYITYWAAEQLAKSGHLVNVNGTPLEQSSSLAHVILLAVLYLVTRLPIPVLGYVVGLVSLGVTVVLTARLAARIRPGTEVPTAVVVAASYPIVFWATGGLETLFAAAAVLGFLSALHTVLSAPSLANRSRAAFLASAILIVTVRPDTMLVSIALVLACAVLAVVRTRLGARASWLPELPGRRVAFGVASLLGAAALLGAFRLVAFHSVLPQPELSKGGGLGWFLTGFSYVFSSFPHWLWAIFVVLSVLGTIWCLRARSLLGLLAEATFALGLLGITFTRGDWMGGARLLVPYLAPGLLVMVLGIWSLGDLSIGSVLLRAWARRVLFAGLVVSEVVLLVYFANGVPWLSSSYSSLDANPRDAIPADLGIPFGGGVTSSESPQPALPWYTSWDFFHTRDAVFLAAATPVVRKLVDEHTGAGKITFASYQAGMIAYSWQNDFPGKLRFIDMDSLVTNDFSRCSGLQPTFAGNIITMQQWEHDAGHCAPPLPDLLFMLYEPPGLTRYYRIVKSVEVAYRNPGFGSSRPIINDELLAVRRGWSPTASNATTTAPTSAS